MSEVRVVRTSPGNVAFSRSHPEQDEAIRLQQGGIREECALTVRSESPPTMQSSAEVGLTSVDNSKCAGWVFSMSSMTGLARAAGPPRRDGGLGILT